MPSAALHRIVYEATIDDAVDVAIRLSSRSKALQKLTRRMIVGTGILGGAAFAAIWISFYMTSPTVSDIAMAAVGGAVFGVPFALLFRRFLARETRKQHRKIVAEQFRGPAIECELELREDGVWTRQMGMETTLPWTLCTAVRDNPGDIEMEFTTGVCVLRDRHFGSAAERQLFLDAARRLAER